MKSNNHIIVFKRCVCHIIVILFWELRNFSTYCHPGQDQNATVEPCNRPPPSPRSLKRHTWKLHDERDIESMGCIFSLISTTWTMQIINTKPRSLDLSWLCAGKSRSSKILTYWHIDTWLHYTVIFKIDLSTLGEFGKDNSHVPYCQFKRL